VEAKNTQCWSCLLQGTIALDDSSLKTINYYPPAGPSYMTKVHLINVLNKKTGLLNKECSRLVESIFELMRAHLISGEKVKIAGFGLFDVKAKKVRRGRNPQTGEQLEISGRKVLRFKVSPIMKKRMEQP
jgi:integration host factor subunit alpha